MNILQQNRVGLYGKILTLVKILSYRPPAQLIRAKDFSLWCHKKCIKTSVMNIYIEEKQFEVQFTM